MEDASRPPALDPQVLITAEQAYPAFERRVLAAQTSIVIGFRIFDPSTLLRSEAAKAVGSTWTDLLADALLRGVRVEIHLSDFDPVAATELHMICWRSVRILCGLRELVGPEAGRNLTIHADLHPAKVGRIARIFFWPFVAAKLRQIVRATEGQEKPSHRRRAMKYIPGAAYLRDKYEGRAMLAFPASHHQKIAAFDDEWLYIGGLDLNERRWDDRSHDRPTQETWHDVQVLLRDSGAATSARKHLETYYDTTAGYRAPIETPGILRTLSRDQSHHRPWTFGPKTVVREIETLHHRAAAAAKDLIYLETQFFRDRRLARALARRGRQNPRLRLMLILPGAPDTVAFEKRPKLDGRFGDFLQSDCIRTVRRGFPSGRLLVASPAQKRRTNGVDIDADRASLAGAPIIYLHAKVSIFDNDLAFVSSANLNGRSMRWDTEAGVAFTARADVEKVRDAAIGHWLSDDIDPAILKTGDAFEAWRRIVRENGKRPPEQRRGFLVPYDTRAADETALALPGVPEEMV